MVCIYCGSPTKVNNSRLQRRNNNIWRRRQCLTCSSIFTTKEHSELSTSFMVQGRRHDLQPFNRDRLFIAIYESCKHRPKAAEEASFLSEIVINKTLGAQQNGVIPRDALVTITLKTLKYFDQVAAAVYAAYHPL